MLPSPALLMPSFDVIGPRLFSAVGKNVSPYVRIMTDIFAEVANTHRHLLTFDGEVHANSRARSLTMISSKAMRLISLKTWREFCNIGFCTRDKDRGEEFVKLCQDKCGGGNDDDLLDVMAEAHRRFVVLEGGE